MRPLFLSLLGPFRAALGDQTIDKFRSNKVQALLIYLATEAETNHRREALMALLWPGLPLKSAQLNLRQALYHLRQAIPEIPRAARADRRDSTPQDDAPVPFLLSDRQTVQLNPAADVRLDATRFSQLLSQSPTPAEMAEAVELYRGDFLADFYLPDSDVFEDWATTKRAELRRQVLDALEALTDFHIAGGAYDEAQAAARRALEIDDLRESAYRGLMKALALDGRRAAALEQFQVCRKHLRDELDVEPSAETTRLYEQIREGELEAAGRAAGHGPGLRGIRGYELQERVGVGGFGEVYRAYQPSVGRQVAVKVILPQYANQPDFIRRFEAEARIVARLEHPHIVPLYDYWREPGGAYLVMRWLRGGDLCQSLQRGPWRADAVAQLLDQIAGALAVAHRQGVVHRDVKPANILLDQERNAYLSDFGIAKDLLRFTGATTTGDVTGSLAYISPEQAQGRPVTPQSDLYSLGVVAYELLTGAHPFASETPANQLIKHVTDPLPALGKRRPDLPGALDEVIQEGTAKNPAQRYPDALAFAAAFREAISPAGTGVAPTPNWAALELINPYKGLRPFEEADAADFFGREEPTERLLARLAPSPSEGAGWGGSAGRFLAIVGPSGSGKSSIVKAGLLPALRRGALPGSQHWYIAEMLPGLHPLDELELGLLQIAVRQPAGLMEQLRRDERGLLRAARLALPTRDSELLLVIDQCEELFAPSVDPAEREHLLGSLYAAVSDPRSRVRVIITLRADFYDRPLLHPAFSQLMRQHTAVVVPLSAAELAAAVREPARRAGTELEPGLVTAIVADVSEQPGALPMLQYALTELFERRDGRTLTREAYQALGGVSGALARRAEEIYAGLDEGGREATRQLFLRLVTLGEGVEDTRRRVLRAELEALTKDDRRTPHALDGADNSSFVLRPSSAMDQVIDTFGKARLLTFDRDPATRAPTVEVAHEALLREWGRLHEWLDESRADVRIQRLLALAAAEWLQMGQDTGFLLRGSRLDQFAGWAENTRIARTQDERAYLDASLAARQARRAKEEAQRQRELETARQLAKAEAVALEEHQKALRQASIGLASQALTELKGKFPERAVPLALEALENYPYTWQAERALGQAVLENRLQLILTGHTRYILHVAWSPDGTRIATASDDCTAIVWDGRTGERLYTVSGHTAPLPYLAWSPDGTRIATVSFDGTAKISDALSGDELFTLCGHEERLFRVAWSPTGDRLVTCSHDTTARVWDKTTGEELFALSHGAPVSAVAWSPSGDQIATGDGAGVIKVWDAETIEKFFILDGHKDWVSHVDWSPSGNHIVTASHDHTVRLWNAATGETLHTLASHRDLVGYAFWSPSGERVATASRDATTRVWDPRTGEAIFGFEPGDPEHPLGMSPVVDWSPSSDRIATSRFDGSITVLDAAPVYEIPRVTHYTGGYAVLTLTGHTGILLSLDWSPTGDRLVTAGVDGTVRVWDVSPSARILTGHSDFVNGVAWSPSGGRIASASNDGTARIWDAATGDELLVTAGQTSLNGVTWSPSGDRIVTEAWLEATPTIRLWDASPSSPTYGEELLVITEDHNGMRWISWSPAGDRFVTGGSGGTAEIRDAATGEVVHSFTAHSGGALLSADWSPVDERIVTSYTRGFALVWDPNTGQVHLKLSVEQSQGAMMRAIWSPDGKRIATYSNDAIGGRIWDARKGQMLLTFTGHTASVYSIDWSANGDRLLTASLDTTAKIWDACTGAELLSYSFGGVLGEGVWSPDMRHIAFGLSDATVRIVDVNWQTREELIVYARQRCLIRELTDDERELFGLPPR